jgi:hypothetical protein
MLKGKANMSKPRTTEYVEENIRQEILAITAHVTKRIFQFGASRSVVQEHPVLRITFGYSIRNSLTQVILLLTLKYIPSYE